MKSASLVLSSKRRKGLISVFIAFHFVCLIAWLLPKPFPLKSWLLGLKLPLPGAAPSPQENVRVWPLALRPVVPFYLYHTAQWQDWAMFAPNPAQTNQYLGAHLIFERGNWKKVTLPRLDQMSWLGAWAQKRYRKLKNRLIDEKSPEYYRDFARWIARERSEPGNSVVRVSLMVYESPIPRHDRKDLQGWTNYSELLREKAVYSPTLVEDYFVQPGDLEP